MDPVKGLSIWLQKRSANKQTWPGYWDNCVSGGLSVGFGISETAIKEAGEEAGIPIHLLGKLKSAGCVSLFFESERGLFPNTEFVYDLELPVDFVPRNEDGEVETFELLPVSECLERVLSSHFKTTSVPVSIDFLIRHGYITPENGNYTYFLYSLCLILMKNLTIYRLCFLNLYKRKTIKRFKVQYLVHFRASNFR